MKNNEYKIKRLRFLWNLKRLPRRRPRDPEEELVLRLMGYNRWRKELEEGKLIELSPKKYKIVINPSTIH
ncbi:MAG: hypothetical protein HWN67_08215 [Candidatus Helarchaeota archaeon]|nr:hypothetical protein [Candidatus Helarchaeota archaeon]